MANVINPQVIQQQHRGGGFLGNLFGLAQPFIPAPWGAVGSAIFGGSGGGGGSTAAPSAVTRGGGETPDQTQDTNQPGTVDVPDPSADEDEQRKKEEEEKERRRKEFMSNNPDWWRSPSVLDIVDGMIP